MGKKFEIEKIEKFDLNGEEVLFAINNGAWLNATKVAKVRGKRMDKFWEATETQAYIKALSKLNYPSEGELKYTRQGRNGGTYIHPQIVLYFAQWVSPEFHIECNRFLEYHMTAKADATAHRLREEKERMSHQYTVKMRELDEKREECEAKIKEYNKQMKEQKDLIIAASALESSPRKRKSVGKDMGFGSVGKWLRLRMESGDINKMSLREVFDKLESKEVRRVTHEKVVRKRYRVLDESLGEDTSSGIIVDFAEMDRIFFSKARKHACAGKKKNGEPNKCSGSGKCKGEAKDARESVIPKAPKGKEIKAKGKPVKATKAETKSKSTAKPKPKPTKPRATKPKKK